ncbi:ABC transporter permease [Methylobacterium sp. 17Sr1-1]|uniref:ABC transporter permease n=1 Tax=Methylobacterium sp. 17Sr1-1 TaxID=2202826 RepID=UPI000D6ED5B0|nr:ABC transporter permease [Methylobacterium sp. 17Sr1-1]AWN53346.1 ABC transporter permease [Methylobacterium sp. 17Sr1-1]
MTHPSPALRRHERREALLVLGLLLPALAVVTVLLLVPLAWLAVQSVTADGAFSLEHYRRFLTEDIYWRSFLLTFRIALVVTVLALLLGYPVAYAAATLPRRWSVVVLGLVILPFWTSVLVRAYAWMVLLQRRGLVNSALQGLGLTDQPIALINNEFGTVLATLHILVPFMVLPLYATMQRIPRDLMLAGASLGGGPAHVFLRVFLPLSMPGVVAGTVLVFVLALGFYITPELLGGGRTFMVSMLVSRNVEIYNQWGAASAIGVVLLVCVAALFWLASRVVPVERIMGAR